MLLSKFQRLLHRISPRSSQKPKESTPEVTCVQNDITLCDETESVNAEPESTAEPTTDTKAHLTSSVPKAAAAPRGSMTPTELREARELFGSLTDVEIHRVYKKVTQ